jgi:hypothetical protein
LLPAWPNQQTHNATQHITHDTVNTHAANKAQQDGTPNTRLLVLVGRYEVAGGHSPLARLLEASRHGGCGGLETKTAQRALFSRQHSDSFSPMTSTLRVPTQLMGGPSRPASGVQPQISRSECRTTSIARSLQSEAVTSKVVPKAAPQASDYELVQCTLQVLQQGELTKDAHPSLDPVADWRCPSVRTKACKLNSCLRRSSA